MPITLIDIIKPKNNQPFPIVEDIDLLGGFRVVPNTTARDGIGVQLKKHGMLVLDSSTKIIWCWNQTGSVWEEAIDLNQLSGSTQAVAGIFTAICPSLAQPGDLVCSVSN